MTSVLEVLIQQSNWLFCVVLLPCKLLEKMKVDGKELESGLVFPHSIQPNK